VPAQPGPPRAETIRWDGTNLAELVAFTGPGAIKINQSGTWLHDSRRRDWVLLPPGHRVIRDTDGDIYPGEPACAS
jgi:hypothetical protein